MGASTSRSTTNRAPQRIADTICACAALMLVVAGCVATPSAEDRQRRAAGIVKTAHLQRIAQSALSGSGNVQVHLKGDIAVVTGYVGTAIDANAVVRALERTEGVSRVENLLSRGM